MTFKMFRYCAILIRSHTMYVTFLVRHWFTSGNNKKMGKGVHIGTKNQNQLSKCCESCHSIAPLTNAGHFHGSAGECACFRITGKQELIIPYLKSIFCRCGYQCWKPFLTPRWKKGFQMRSHLRRWFLLRRLRWWRMQQEEEKGGDDDERESTGYRARAELQQKQGQGEKAD